MKLEEILSSKPLYYTKFDPNRIVEAYELIKDKINHPKRVQIIGTNGKGSTGRAIAHLAYKSGLSVGHFTSPHILDFKERFWINGKFATNQELESANSKLEKLLGDKMRDALSYFEYQALLAFVLFENLDLQVIEAGLGGEFDATSVAKYDLTVVTPIGLDHADFLGETIKEVATTKLKAIDKEALIALQVYDEVYSVAKDITKEKGAKLHLFKDIKTDNLEQIESIAKEKAWAKYLVQNILNATFALDILGVNYRLKDLKTLKIFGRFYRLKENVTIDVGHNYLAAMQIVKALPKRVDLIFNILSDKGAKRTLEILKPKIRHLHIIKIDTQRATNLEELEAILKELNIEYGYFNGDIKKDRDYLVFGSFYVVEQFLKSIGVKSIDSE